MAPIDRLEGSWFRVRIAVVYNPALDVECIAGRLQIDRRCYSETASETDRERSSSLRT